MLDVDDALERSLWDLFWLPPGVHVVDRPELLYLASDEGDDNLNTVLRVRATDAAADALVEEVDRAHRVRSRWQLAPRSQSDALARALREHRYDIAHEHHAYSIRCDALPSTTTDVEVRAVANLDELRAAINVNGRAFGRTFAPTDARLAADLAMCTSGRVHRFVAYAHGLPIASAGMTVHPALDLVFLWGGGTVPEARGRGAYRALLAARIALARALSISRAGVYARNESAAPIVERLGFVRHAPMTYWSRQND
jgi:GNAT superfamily N-acetyltransferase